MSLQFIPNGNQLKTYLYSFSNQCYNKIPEIPSVKINVLEAALIGGLTFTISYGLKSPEDFFLTTSDITAPIFLTGLLVTAKFVDKAFRFLRPFTTAQRTTHIPAVPPSATGSPTVVVPTSVVPTVAPTVVPTVVPTVAPTVVPTVAPSIDSEEPADEMVTLASVDPSTVPLVQNENAPVILSSPHAPQPLSKPQEKNQNVTTTPQEHQRTKGFRVRQQNNGSTRSRQGPGKNAT